MSGPPITPAKIEQLAAVCHKGITDWSQALDRVEVALNVAEVEIQRARNLPIAERKQVTDAAMARVAAARQEANSYRRRLRV